MHCSDYKNINSRTRRERDIITVTDRQVGKANQESKLVLGFVRIPTSILKTDRLGKNDMVTVKNMKHLACNTKGMVALISFN